MTSIATPNGELTAVQVIWDRDHGSKNEGWYVRSRYADGHEEDDIVGALEGVPCDANEDEIHSIALLFLLPPDGVSDAEYDALRDMIEVRR